MDLNAQECHYSIILCTEVRDLVVLGGLCQGTIKVGYILVCPLQ